MTSDSQKESKIWANHGSSYAFVNFVPEKLLISDASPIASMKAIKNEVEIQGAFDYD